VELSFTIPADAAEAYADALTGAGAAGIEERDATTLAPPPPGCAELLVWVAPDEVDRLLGRVAASGLPEARVARRDREEDEWRDAWKRYFTARRVGRFVLVPSWEAYRPGPDEIVLHLDPGRAFGTGGHASTRLCLEAIGGEGACARFLDVGCGSGVLAIACAARFSRAVGVGVDVDPDAIEVSRENAGRNGVADRIRFSTAGLEALDGAFDLVTANIQPEVLIPMAPLLSARTAGRLILSGILVEAAPAVEAAFLRAGLQRAEVRDEEGWRALVMAR